MIYLILGAALVGVLTCLVVVVAGGLYTAMYEDYLREMDHDEKC